MKVLNFFFCVVCLSIFLKSTAGDIEDKLDTAFSDFQTIYNTTLNETVALLQDDYKLKCITCNRHFNFVSQLPPQNYFQNTNPFAIKCLLCGKSNTNKKFVQGGTYYLHKECAESLKKMECDSCKNQSMQDEYKESWDCESCDDEICRIFLSCLCCPCIFVGCILGKN